MKSILSVSLAMTPLLALAQPAPLPSVAPNLDRIAGVYKHRFANGDVQGDSYTSEDIFELVKLSPKAAYFRIHSEFFNGHVCGIFGIADLEADALTYHGPPDYQGDPCLLKFTVNMYGVIVNDIDNDCKIESCGARGSYSGFNYPFKTRQTIRYLPLILKSKEFAAAVKQHDAHPIGTPSPQF